MADNLDPEVLAQFQEAMRQATEAAKAMPAAMSSMVDTINKAQSSLKNNTKATEDQTDAVEDNTEAVEENEAMLEAQAESAKKEKEARNLQTAALNQARTSLISFGDALLSGTRGFEKYNKSINSAGDAALDFGKSLGVTGTILGIVVKGATMVAGAMMKQADDTLKATDELSKMGTAGAFSAEQVRKMGTGLGLASDQLDKLVKPVKSLGSSLISLGGNAADGADAFAKLAVVTSEQRQAYQRLGISQEEQIQNTADFINLQTQQGRQITEQMKRDGTLRNAAREYTDNLLELAALTGKDIEAVKKKNELAMGEIETAIQNNLLDQEINRLRKLDTNESRARANQLEQERKARDKLLQRVENEVGDPALRKGLAKFLATGAITEEVAALKRIGVPVEDFASKIKQGVDVSDQFMDSLSKNGDAMVRNVGTAAMFDENTRKAFGVSSEFMNYLAKARDRDEKSMSDLTRARIADTKAGKGAAGEDPAQKARNALTEAEISAKVALDDLVASANPLLNNFSDMSLTIKALIVATGLATVALAGLAAAALKNAAQDAIAKGTTTGKILDAATSTGTGLAKATKIGGAAAAVGMGAYEMYQGRKQADEDLAAGKITAAEAKEKKQDVTYGAAGGTAGALVLGTLGSALGPVGTIVGGMVGQAVGEKLGKWAASWDDKTDPKTTKVKDQVQIQEEKFALNREKYALEQQATDQTVSEAERKLAQIKLRTIAKEEALLLNQEAINEYKNAKTDEEKEAAKGKSDRARATLAQLKTEEATYQLGKETDDKKRKALEAQLLQARNDFAQVEIHRATQILKSNANEEEKKAAQARLDNAKKQLEQETITIKKSEEIRKAEEELEKAVGDEKKKEAEAKIKLLKESLEKELEAINKKYNTADAKPVEAAPTGQSNSGRFTVVEAYADGGTIPDGKVGIVGEKGPELVTGPAGVLNAEQIRKAVEMGGVPAGLNLSDTGMAYASNSPFAKVMLAYETKARNDKAFQKRIQDALKNSSSGNLDPYETLAFALETVEGQRWAAENDFGIDISSSMDKGPNKEIRSYFNQILKQIDKEAFAGFFADGGIIPKGKFGVVGEKGPEFVSGPAGITNQDQFAESTEEFIDTFFETDKAVKEFDKELSGFVKDDPAGKMTKQLNLVTTALEDLNELINPNVPGGLELPGSGAGQVKVPSASKIASAVMSQLSGILGGGSMPTAGGGGAGASAAMPAGSGDMPAPKTKSKGILGAIASALGFSSDTSDADSGGKDSGDAIPTPSGSIDMLDMKKSAATNVPVGNMSEDDIKKMIIRHEGVRYRPYKDSLGLWTVGIGHLIGDGKTLPASWNREFSKEEVLGLFEKDYEHHRQAAERIPGFDRMNTVGQGALTDLTFNMGPAWINKWPNTKRKLEQGDVAGAAENLEDSKWYGQVGNRAPTIVNMVRQGMKAAQGGIFDGPSTGYPVEMHGKEMVTRLDPNSLLEKLAKTPASQIASEMNQPAKVDMIDRSQEGMKELAAINVQMMEMLSEKLDGMINRLDTSNETQDKLLKFSQA